MQVVDVTGNRTGAIDDLSTKIAGATTEDLARTPFLLIGSHEEMAAQMLGEKFLVIRKRTKPSPCWIGKHSYDVKA